MSFCGRLRTGFWFPIFFDRIKRKSKFNLRARRFAPLFMIIFGLTMTVAAFDWISSLEPTWYSDIFAFSGAPLVGRYDAGASLSEEPGRLQEVGPDHMYSLGGFLFAFIVFWSYIGFAQYMLMWYANLPEEVFWYKRAAPGRAGTSLWL